LPSLRAIGSTALLPVALLLLLLLLLLRLLLRLLLVAAALRTTRSPGLRNRQRE
jgi:hypothetical protein